jgi:uncharacterized protein
MSVIRSNRSTGNDREPAAAAGDPPGRVKEMIERQLRCLVLETPFPCLGARSAFRRGSYQFNVHQDMRTAGTLDSVAADLRHFADVRRDLGDFYSYIASFTEPALIPSEAYWDELVWDFLQRLHDADTEPWENRWSTDPKDYDFALSFAGLGHLVVALYPGASRYARRFAWPTLVFNPPEQDRANFPDDESFLRFQNHIRDRDERLQGSVNPALPPTLDDPQAPGFSGAPVDESWRCPLVIRENPERP